MNPSQVLAKFVSRVLVPAKSRRFAALTTSKKGQRKILEGLSHEFEPAIRAEAIQNRNYDGMQDRPCFVFHYRLGFGVGFPNVRSAYDHLSLEDSWLIILQDASAGIFRPEAHWDDEKLLSR
jgi:hypothetical protein